MTTQTTTHTPGPWKVDKEWMGPESYGDGDSIPIFPAIGGVAICDVVARNGVGLSRPDIQAQAEANARLIAASPDLLAALEICLDRLASHPAYQLRQGQTTCGSEYSQDGGFCPIEANCAHCIARAAIAKAKGE